MKEVSSKRVRITCEYVRHESKQGFKGHWTSQYVFRNARSLNGELLADMFTLGKSSAIKGKGYRAGDILCMSVTMVTYEDRSVAFKNPRTVEKVLT